MNLKIKSSVYPEPQTFNEWQEWLYEQRQKIYLDKLGRAGISENTKEK